MTPPRSAPASARAPALDPALDPAAIARALTKWFVVHARDLPWRRTRDPYAIWVSEIMLQQTRVDTVMRYWDGFLQRFPTVAALASADEQAVLEAWSGLGYYRRARLLHRGARYLHEHCDDALPEDAAELRAIPGVGRYTVGAIASIAFDRPVPLVDGNVARVHARLAAIADPQLQDAKAEAHWTFVTAVLEHGSPRVLAQALMELGATVCTPRSPSCDDCPLRRSCRARAADLQATIPAVKQKQTSPQQHFDALALRWRGKLLMERRSDDGLLAGMWCLPLLARGDNDNDSDNDNDDDDGAPLVERAEAALGGKLRFEAQAKPPVKHVFTHRIWHLHPWLGQASRAPKLRGRADGRELAWVGAGELPAGGVPTLTRKLLRRIEHE